MKQTIKNIFYCIVLLTIFILISCEKDAKNTDWGIAKIYMPQAAIVSGGLNNNYPVPWSSGNGVENYIIDSSEQKNNINVILGVYRSGLQPLEQYSVDVKVNNDTVTQLINNGTLTNTILLPAKTFLLPASVTVPDGQRESTFYLTIDRNKLLQDSVYSGKNLALAVSIANPSKYELNTSLSTTIVLVSDWETLK